MAKIFKPRRGKKSTMAGSKKATVLSAGEMFIEVPDTGAGTGHSKMKIGDGSTQYSSLPYAMGDTENDKIAFSNDTSGNITTALNKVTSGAALKTMIAALKQAVSLANTSITQLNDDLADKASKTNGVLYWNLDNGYNIELRKTGSNGEQYDLSYVLNKPDGGQSMYPLFKEGNRNFSLLTDNKFDIYRTLSDLGLKNEGVTITDIFSAMSGNSILIMDANNSNMVTDIPEEGSGLLEILKSSNRNIIRYTKSNSIADSIDGTWYGSFRWNPDNKFLGWHKIASTDDIISKSDVTLKIYYSLSSAGIPTSAKLTMKDIWDKLPDGSYLITDVEGVNDITDLPSNDTYGVLEIYKKAQTGRNYARFTPSVSSAAGGSMFYGTFAWSTGSIVFTGWKRIIESSRLANNLTTTAEEYALDARQGKALNDKITSMQSSFQAGVNTLYNKCTSHGVTPSNKTPTGIATAIDNIYIKGRKDVYKNSKTITGYGNLGINITTKPSSGTYTVDENTFNIPIKDKILHKITCDLVHKFSASYTDASAFTSGMQITISTVEGATLYTAYVHKTNSDNNVLMDGKTYNYIWEFDTLDYTFNTSYDYIKFYARCFVRMQYASYVNSINMTFQINNITANYH